MNKILTILFIFICLNATATNYYIANAGSDANNGTSTGTPWQTLAKISAHTFSPGDSMFFNRGDVFYGGMTVGQSGAAGNPIWYGAYGTGKNPQITGFTTVSAWTSLGGNIWESTSTVSALTTQCMMVSINGVNTPMGRYPNTGYLTYQSAVDATSITSSSLTGTPNWSGGLVAIKKTRWVIDTKLITSQSGGTLNYPGGSPYPGVGGWGFFIESDSLALDTLNEWFYSTTRNKLDVYNTVSPTNVKIATVTDLVLDMYHNYIVFDHIDLNGANNAAFNLWSTKYFKIQHCNITYCGVYGVWGQDESGNVPGAAIGDSVMNDTFRYINNDAIDFTGVEFSYAMIQNCLIKSTGIIPGMSGNADGGAFTVEVNGSYSTVQNNEIDSSGYLGINFSGDTIMVQYNLVNTYCMVKQDGGGIYCGNNGIFRTIQYNTVLNGIGLTAGQGTGYGPISDGIYLDEGTKSTYVLYNNVYNAYYDGIFLHDPLNCQAIGNTVYGCIFSQFEISLDNSSDSVTGNTVTGNIFFADTLNTTLFPGNTVQYTARYYDLSNTFSRWGTIDNNYYVRPINDATTIRCLPTGDGSDENLSLAGWVSTSSQDSHSHQSPKAITNPTDLLYEYNATGSSVPISLPFNYMDATGLTYNGSITLAPYSSAVLIKNGAINTCFNCIILR